MNINYKIIGYILLLAVVFSACSKKINVGKVFSDAEKQTHIMLQEIPKARGNKPELVSPRTLIKGELLLVQSRDWTSGFFPGVLWYLNEYTKKAEWRTEAEKFTANIEKEKTNGTTHDMGFKVYCSFGNGYRLHGDQHYKDVIIQSAKTLSTRFRPIVGTLRSWDHSRDRWGFPVIVDNMMNLELLFAATRLTGDSSFYKIAVSHANTTIKNHFREDYSTFHVVDYDTTNGKVINKHTAQGQSHSSTWSRGQSWALYGYTVCYRETKDPLYLKYAEGAAKYILDHPNLPKDMVPYWDFDAPNIPNEPRDASAAAINASALYELSLYSSNGRAYKKAADKIVKSLTDNYRSPMGENKGWILLHSTRAKPPDSEVDVPLTYADYYYLEAVLRMKKLKEGKNLF